MSNPFAGKPKWKTGKWGKMPPNAITPMPQVVTKGNAESTPSNSKLALNVQTSEKPMWKKYVIPIVIIVATLAAIAVVAVVIFVIKYRNNKKNQQKVPNKFTPAKPVTQNPQPPTPVQNTQQEVSTEQRPTEEELHNVTEVAKKLGLEEEENKLQVKKVPTTKDLMEEYVRRHKDEETDDEESEKDDEGQNDEDEEPEPTPKKHKKKAIQKTKSMREVAERQARRNESEDKEGPPLEEPLPRVSYKDIDPKSKRPKKKENTPEEEQQDTTPEKVAKVKVMKKELNMKKVQQSAKPAKKANAKITAAYLASLLKKAEENEGQNEDDEEQVGVVELDENEEEDQDDQQNGNPEN